MHVLWFPDTTVDNNKDVHANGDKFNYVCDDKDNKNDVDNNNVDNYFVKYNDAANNHDLYYVNNGNVDNKDVDEDGVNANYVEDDIINTNNVDDDGFDTNYVD